MKLHTYLSQQQQVNSLIDYIALKVNTLLATQDHVTIALSGGKSPIKFLNQLSHAKLNFSKIIFTLVDERVVDTNSQDSNQKLIQDNLLINNAAQATFIGLYDNTDSTAQLIIKRNQQQLKIDIAIIGMGEDGHFASIFPCCKELSTALDLQNKNQFVLTSPNTAKYDRISLSLAAIKKIPNLILSIQGQVKLDILIKAAQEKNNLYPISHLLQVREDLEVFYFA
ncbi:MAG: 6-phosphogluconolactonase [Burkholderiales bacterium]|nr:6-phosphogluconolactonase [Burkholderiales bacterium]